MCGASLAPPQAPREERKVVTVLFCDLVGFTARAEQMDPEDVRALLAPYHGRVRSELERHGGTVEKFIGDAVMALFGAPVAHEDDPERAVRAALAIRDFAMEERLELRIGITTGEALVALDASPEAGEGMASGDVVNTAARLQTAAPVNGIIVGEGTYRATRHAVDYRKAEPVQAKGKVEPVTAWEAIEARARFGSEVLDHAAGELVGRERELETVQAALTRVREEGSSQLLTLVGVPGIGKSRLLHELSRIADAEPDLITWRQGRCLAYGEGVTFWALAEIVKAQAGIHEADSDGSADDKLHAAVKEFVEPSDVEWVQSRLRPLVGLADESELGGDRSAESFAAWRRFFEGIAAERTTILVFEDLQWADDGLLDFVDDLVDWVTAVPLLVVCTARPELLARRPGWGGGKLNAATLALTPLTADQTARLIAQVLEQAVIPAEVQAALLERAEGNPLYAEQFAQLYRERGTADDLPLPETLQGIIAARLDGLSSDEKGLLQAASVLGKVFWSGALDVDPPETQALLHSLERKGFVRRQRRSSVAGETEVAFAHALVRDVAYGQIPRAERAQRHRSVAEWIDSLGRAEDHAEMAAFHWRTALELGQASGTADARTLDRARRALRDAGDRAFALDASSVAASRYDDALALWPTDDPERPELLFRRARALFYAYDEDRRYEALLDARDALLGMANEPLAGEAEAFLANVAWERGAGELVEQHLREAERLVSGESSPSAARVLAVSARMHELKAHHEEALRLGEAALALAEALGLAEIRAHALTTVGMAKGNLGDSAEGIADMEQALEIALQANSRVASPIANNLAVQANIGGDFRRADRLYAEAIRLAERFGDAASIRFVQANRIWIDLMFGRWETALRNADAFIAECESGSPHNQEGPVRDYRAAIRWARGDTEAALDDQRRALALAREARGSASFEVLGALALLSASEIELGHLDRARALVDELVPLVREHGPHGTLVRLAPFADELGVTDSLRDALAQGAGPRASFWHEVIDLAYAGDLGAAADAFAQTGNLFFEAQLRFYGGLRFLDEGLRDPGVAELSKALEFFRSVDASYYVERAEAGLLGRQESA
jgi:class 3 adenylate cyclase/tetratricopeptide (TPR) repeat protein